jgi:hypothetical protein
LKKEYFDSLKKENFDSLKRKILTVLKGKFNRQIQNFHKDPASASSKYTQNFDRYLKKQFEYQLFQSLIKFLPITPKKPLISKNQDQGM